MKKALFSLQTIVNPWKPPFNKKIESEEVEVMEGQGFDSMEKVEGNVFTLVKCNSDKCLVRYSEQFTLKAYQHRRDKEVWVGKEPVSFTYFWGEDRITKKLSLKQIFES
jgi:hypothetical protein